MMTPKERAAVSIQNESETVSSLSMMRTAMQQALEALEELFHSNSTKVAVEKYNTAHNELLEALEQTNEIDWIETNKALAKEVIELQKQAEQEPVLWGDDKFAPYERPQKQEPVCCDKCGSKLGTTVVPCDCIAPMQQAEQKPMAIDWEPMQNFWRNNSSIDWGELESAVKCAVTTPVRTKDLTDDEICFWIGRFPFLLNEESEKWIIGLARAVIAADRSKNRG